MPANDTIYSAVKNALVKDGWTITHDPYTVKFGGVRVHADLAAEKVLAAERGSERSAGVSASRSKSRASSARHPSTTLKRRSGSFCFT